MENDQTVYQNPAAATGQSIQPPQAGPVPPLQPQPIQPQPFQSPNTSLPPLPSAQAPSNPPPKKKLSLPPNILKIFLGLIAVIVIIGLVGFLISFITGKKGSNVVTVNYWGLWEDSKTMQPIITEFEAQNPTIKINYVRQDVKQYRDTLATRINNGNGPDIFLYHNTWYPMLSSVLLPIPSSVISSKEFSDAFYPVSQKDLIKNGAIYGVPSEMDTLAMYVNKDILSAAGVQPPTTWNEFVDVSRTLTVKDADGKIKTAGAAMGTYDNITHAPDILSLLFLQNSADFTNMDASAERIQGALNFYTSFATDENNVWDNTLDPSILAFSKGNLALYFGYSWDFFTIKQYNPNINIEVLPIPQLADQSVNMASYWVNGVSLKTPHQKEALLFAKFLAQKSTEQTLYSEQSKLRAFGEPYGRVDLADSLKENPLVYPFVSQAKTADSTFFVSDTNDNGLNEQLNTYLANAINSILFEGNSVESAYETFAQGVTQVLQKYGQ